MNTGRLVFLEAKERDAHPPGDELRALGSLRFSNGRHDGFLYALHTSVIEITLGYQADGYRLTAFGRGKPGVTVPTGGHEIIGSDRIDFSGEQRLIVYQHRTDSFSVNIDLATSLAS